MNVLPMFSTFTSHIVVLLATGSIFLLFGDQAPNTVIAGQVLCASSVVPFACMVLRWVEDCRFVTQQKEYDRVRRATILSMRSDTSGVSSDLSDFKSNRGSGYEMVSTEDRGGR